VDPAKAQGESGTVSSLFLSSWRHFTWLRVLPLQLAKLMAYAGEPRGLAQMGIRWRPVPVGSQTGGSARMEPLSPGRWPPRGWEICPWRTSGPAR